MGEIKKMNLEIFQSLNHEFSSQTIDYHLLLVSIQNLQVN